MSDEELRALAEAATPGPWSFEALGSEGHAVRAEAVPYASKTRRPTVARCGWETWETDTHNAAFIAAANPAAVLGLLDERDALRAQVERVRALADEWRSAAEGARQSAARSEDLPTRHQHNRAANDYGYTAARIRAALDPE